MFGECCKQAEMEEIEWLCWKNANLVEKRPDTNKTKEKFQSEKWRFLQVKRVCYKQVKKEEI